MAAKERTPLPSSRPHKRKFESHPDSSHSSEPPLKSISARRKRGKTKAITSCERCRQAHVKCVARGPGDPCESCAKRSTWTCSFAQSSNQPATSPKVDQEETEEVSTQDQELQMIAATALKYLKTHQSKA